MNDRSALPTRSRSGGYTAVEILMAMAVMAIGAAGVMSMQKASIQGNLEARKADIASSLARTWVERLRRDAMLWTTPGPNDPGAPSNLPTALVVQYGATNAGTWFLPNQYASLAVPLSPGFDILGRDVPQQFLLQDAVFCTHVRLTWLDTGLLRADVRVLWSRDLANGGPAAPVCSPGVATSNTPDPLAYHALYVTTALRGNPQ